MGYQNHPCWQSLPQHGQLCALPGQPKELISSAVHQVVYLGAAVEVNGVNRMVHCPYPTRSLCQSRHSLVTNMYLGQREQMAPGLAPRQPSHRPAAAVAQKGNSSFPLTHALPWSTVVSKPSFLSPQPWLLTTLLPLRML